MKVLTTVITSFILLVLAGHASSFHIFKDIDVGALVANRNFFQRIGDTVVQPAVGLFEGVGLMVSDTVDFAEVISGDDFRARDLLVGQNKAEMSAIRAFENLRQSKAILNKLKQDKQKQLSLNKPYGAKRTQTEIDNFKRSLSKDLAIYASLVPTNSIGLGFQPDNPEDVIQQIKVYEQELLTHGSRAIGTDLTSIKKRTVLEAARSLRQNEALQEHAERKRKKRLEGRSYVDKIEQWEDLQDDISFNANRTYHNPQGFFESTVDIFESLAHAIDKLSAKEVSNLAGQALTMAIGNITVVIRLGAFQVTKPSLRLQ